MIVLRICSLWQPLWSLFVQVSSSASDVAGQLQPEASFVHKWGEETATILFFWNQSTNVSLQFFWERKFQRTTFIWQETLLRPGRLLEIHNIHDTTDLMVFFLLLSRGLFSFIQTATCTFVFNVFSPCQKRLCFACVFWLWQKKSHQSILHHWQNKPFSLDLTNSCCDSDETEVIPMIPELQPPLIPASVKRIEGPFFHFILRKFIPMCAVCQKPKREILSTQIILNKSTAQMRMVSERRLDKRGSPKKN